MLKQFIFFISACFLFSCAYTEKVRDGKTAYDRKQFYVATKMLQKEFNKEKSKAQKGKIAFLIAESYQKLGKNNEAAQWYKSAYDNSFGAEALRGYADALKANEDYSNAILQYKELGIELGSPFEVKKDIAACQNALAWISPKARSPYTVSKVDFNSSFDDYSPTYFASNQLVITSDRPNANSSSNYKWTGHSFSELFLIDINNNAVKNFGSQINSSTNEGCATFNKDYSKMVFIRSVADEKNGDEYMKLFTATREEVLWSLPKELNFCKEKVNYWHPVLSSDGKKLFFASNDSEGFGGFDIYESIQRDNGEWSDPKLLPRNINTIGNEVFPTLHNDTLYFSSDFHAGMGGLDIFKTYPINNGWASPQNMKAPINSGGDDFSLIIDNQFINSNNILQKGYLSSNRKGGLGGDDIYAFNKIVLPPLPQDTTDKNKNKKETDLKYSLILDGYVLEKIFQQSDNPNSKVIGRRPIANAAITILFGKEKKNIITNDEGFFTINLSENTDYQIFANKENYLNNSTNFSSRGIVKDPNNPTQRFEVELILDKIFKNKEITLENIYYDFDKSDIRDDAKPTLNILAQTMKDNPNIKIQLSSHTDCQGSDSYNEDLSQRRAQSAVDYLISLGIDTSRLVAKGYGESSPAIPCICNKCTDAENQANRRTTFKIVD